MIKELNKYKIKLDHFDIGYYDHVFKHKSLGEIIDYIINEMDCTRETSIGRPMQTINYGYKVIISIALNIISGVELEDDRNHIIKRIYDKHLENIEFEKNNPPVVYVKNNNKTKTTKKTNKTSPIEKKEVKPKLDKLKLKLSFLNVKLK